MACDDIETKTLARAQQIRAFPTIAFWRQGKKIVDFNPSQRRAFALCMHAPSPSALGAGSPVPPGPRPARLPPACARAHEAACEPAPRRGDAVGRLIRNIEIVATTMARA